MMIFSSAGEHVRTRVNIYVGSEAECSVRVRCPDARECARRKSLEPEPCPEPSPPLNVRRVGTVPRDSYLGIFHKGSALQITAGPYERKYCAPFRARVSASPREYARSGPRLRPAFRYKASARFSLFVFFFFAFFYSLEWSTEGCRRYCSIPYLDIESSTKKWLYDKSRI